MRRMPIQIPCRSPNLDMASNVYCEQVGEYLQVEGSTCEMVTW